MSKKYVIEMKSEYEDTIRGIMVLGARDSNLYMDALAVEDMEELNSDYINEHFGDLQDTAYKKGLHDGESKCRYCTEYQRGLNDAWEAAKKIALMDTETSENVTGYFGLFRIMENLTPMQALEKLKAYEEKQKVDDEIKVGDEVNWDGDNYIVTYINIDIDTSEVKDYDLMMWDGGVVDHVKKCSFVKTDRHFDIKSILEAMKA